MYESPRAQLLIQRAVRAGGRLAAHHIAARPPQHQSPLAETRSGRAADRPARLATTPACQVCACPADELSQRTLPSTSRCSFKRVQVMSRIRFIRRCRAGSCAFAPGIPGQSGRSWISSCSHPPIPRLWIRQSSSSSHRVYQPCAATCARIPSISTTPSPSGSAPRPRRVH